MRVQRQITAAEAVQEAMEFARSSWRRAGLIQLVAAAGIAMLFISLRAPLAPAAAGRLSQAGLVVSLLAWAPLWAVLHSLALGGSAARRVWRGGLQFGWTELRFLVLGGAAVVAATLSLLPLVAISAGVFLVCHGMGQIDLWPFGRLQISFLIAALVWLAGAASLGYAAARLAFSPAATVSRRRLVIAEAWPLTEGRVGAVAAAWILAQGPAVLCLALLALADSLELLDNSTRWPMPDAIVAGAILGLIVAFVQAPLTSGVLGLMYRRQRTDRAEAAVEPPVSPLAPPRSRPISVGEPLAMQALSPSRSNR
jgi:hypothetical protein